MLTLFHIYMLEKVLEQEKEKGKKQVDIGILEDLIDSHYTASIHIGVLHNLIEKKLGIKEQDIFKFIKSDDSEKLRMEVAEKFFREAIETKGHGLFEYDDVEVEQDDESINVFIKVNEKNDGVFH